MGKRILLVTTSFEGISQNKLAKTSEYLHYPMGLAYLHSYLESVGNSVITLALNHKTPEECFKIVHKNIHDFSPEIIGIQVLTATRVSVYSLIEQIHERYPKIKIILGGIHTTVMYKQLIEKFPFVIAVLGEGELTIDELSRELFKKKPNLKKIDGIAFFDNGEAIRTRPRELIKNLDELPFPKHEPFLNDPKRTSACLLTSRGCPFACTFCCLNPESKRIVRFRSPQNVVDEMEYLIKKFPHIKEIFIHDDSFFIHNKRVIEICKEIIQRKIKIDFVCSGRMRPISKEMVFYLEKAGFKRVLLGLESGAEEILKSCGKGILPEDAIKTFKLFKNTSISPKVFLIVGLPGENIKTVWETIRLVKKLQKIKYMLAPDDFGLLTIYPGTVVYEIAKKKGFIDETYWLSDKETPIYTAENSYEKLNYFKRLMAENLSLYKIKTIRGFSS